MCLGTQNPNFGTIKKKRDPRTWKGWGFGKLSVFFGDASPGSVDSRYKAPFSCRSKLAPSESAFTVALCSILFVFGNNCSIVD